MKRNYELIVGIVAGMIVATLIIFNAVDQSFLTGVVPREMRNALTFTKEVSEYNIPDECGNVFDAVLHTVVDEAQCLNRCQTTCMTMDQQFKHAEFQAFEDRCNSCACFCK